MISIRKLIYCLSVLVLLTGYCMPVFSQNAELKSKLRQAKGLMRADSREYSPERSFALFLDCANQGSAEAMNAVGSMYATGVGVNKDLGLSKQWFEKSADAGYAKSYYNLATIYKDYEQDFEKAYSYYEKASDLGEPAAWYGQGYMLYKGLGCQQDYKKAFELFTKGADQERGTCMHFLGLCYLNGYGTKQDIDLAKKWLTKSALQGNTEAMKALTLDGAEGVPASMLSEIESNMDIPSYYKDIRHKATHNEVAGNYKGYLVAYDWSGNKIVQLLQLELKMEMDENGNITGEWIEGLDIFAKINASLNDDGLLFNSNAYSRRDNYNNEGLWQLKNATLNIVRTDTAVFMKGNLKMHSLETSEPGKPMYITLARSSVSKVPEKQSYSIATYPNPCVDKVTLSFTASSASEVQVTVHSLLGEKILQRNLGSFTAGEQQNVELPLDCPSGMYVLNVTCGNALHKTVILKR